MNRRYKSRNYLFPETRAFAKRLEESIAQTCNRNGIACLGMHGFRALFAQEFIERRMAVGLTERQARRELTTLLGHSRIDVTYRYVPKL